MDQKLVQVGPYTTIHPKPHAHVMLTQMNVKEGLKEFRQLHDKKELLPMKKENMSYDKQKRCKISYVPEGKKGWIN